jgi:hypothetical protein
MSAKKLETILSLVQVAENNLKNVQTMVLQLMSEKGVSVDLSQNMKTPGLKSRDEDSSLEVQEGYFDGENMIGDNGQIYTVPQNYASKTQLVVGDRMKWILTEEREIFKLIQPTPRIRVTGTFGIEGDNYIVLVDEFTSPIKILKASSTYAMKNLGLKIGDEVSVYIPKEGVPTWGAFVSVVKPGSPESRQFQDNKNEDLAENTSAVSEKSIDESEILKEFKMLDDKPASADDYF